MRMSGTRGSDMPRLKTGPGAKRGPVLRLSSATGAGVKEALRALLGIVNSRAKVQAEAQPAPEWRP